MKFVRRIWLGDQWVDMDMSAPHPVDGTPVDPPVSGDLTLGIGAWNPQQSFSTLYQQAKTTLGTPHAGIYFPNGSPLRWDTRCALIQDDAILAVTFKDWSQSAVTQFCADAAANHSGLVYLNWMNEVDNPDKNVDPSLYKQRIAYISSQTRQHSNTRSFTQIMEYGIRAGRVDDYLSGVDVDCFGWSIFGNNKNLSPQQQVNNVVAKTRQFGGADMPFEIFGWGANPDRQGSDSARAQWITTCANALRDTNCAHALWFNNIGPAGDFTLDDQVSLDAWTAQVTQNPS